MEPRFPDHSTTAVPKLEFEVLLIKRGNISI